MGPTIQDLIRGYSFQYLGSEVVGSLSSAAQLFAKAPIGAKMAIVTVGTKSIRYKYSNETPTTTEGHLLTADGDPFIFWLEQPDMKLVKAIETAATTVVFVSYFGATA